VAGEAGSIPARLVEPRDDAAGDGIDRARKDDRDRPRLPLDGSRRQGPGCYDDVGLQADQLLREHWYPIDVPCHRRSIRKLRPSGQPKPASACVNAETTGFAGGSFSSPNMMTVPGIGPIISSATVAAIGTGDAFAKGRDFGAWLGL